MDREAWWATVHRVGKVRHDLATKPLPHRSFMQDCMLFSVGKCALIYLFILLLVIWVVSSLGILDCYKYSICLFSKHTPFYRAYIEEWNC